MHDELALELESSVFDSVRILIIETMKHAVGLSVRLLAETGTSANRMEAKQVFFDT